MFALNKKADETFLLKSILSFPTGTLVEEAIASNNKNHVLIKTSLYRDYLDKNVSILYGVDLRYYLNSGSDPNRSIFTYTKEFQTNLDSGLKQICPLGDDKFVTFYQEAPSYPYDPSSKIIPMITKSNFSSLVPISNISESENEKLYSCQNIGVNKTIFTSTLNETNTGLYLIDDKMQIHQLQKFNSPEVSITDYKEFGGDELWLNLSTDELLRYKIYE